MVGWLVKASSQADSIFSSGEDSINAGEGDDFIKISGSSAAILTGKNNDTISVDSGVKSFIIKDFSNTTALIGAEEFSSIATANDDGTSVVSFAKSTTTSGINGNDGNGSNNSGQINLTESTQDYSSVGNLVNDNLPKENTTDPTTIRTREVTRNISSGNISSDELYTVDLSTVNTLNGYFVAGNSTFQSGEPSNAIGIVSSFFAPSFLDVDDKGNLSFTYRGLKLNIKGVRENGEVTNAINVDNINTLNDSTSNNYYQWIIISGLYKWWLKEALDLNDEATGLNFNDGGASVTEMDLYFEFDDKSGWLAYVHRDSLNGQAIHLDLVVNSKYFSGLTSDTDPNCDGYVNGSGGRLDRTIAHEFNHAVFGANVNYFGQLPMFIKEGMAELVHGVDDDRRTPMQELIDNAINKDPETVTYLDSWVNLNLNNSTQEETISGGTSKAAYSYASGYMFLRWLAKTSAESDTVPLNEVIARVELHANQNGFYYVSIANNGNIYERPAEIGNGGTNFVSVGSAVNNVYTANGSIKQSISYGGGAWTINDLGEGSSVMANDADTTNDSITSTAAKLYVNSGKGDDVINLNGGYNSVFAGAGNDTVSSRVATTNTLTSATAIIPFHSEL
ncbi:MAG: hypothetical protein SR1Q5_01435 [Quinella sp. 1Q5]|nr:hypothetical protein [Quinella sp. 1Q5]